MRVQLSRLHPPPDLHVPKHAQGLQWSNESPVHHVQTHVGRTEGLAVGREGGKEGGRKGGVRERSRKKSVGK